MLTEGYDAARLAACCNQTTPDSGISGLEAGLNRLMPQLEFRAVLTRGSWHRLGGVVDSQLQRVSDNLSQWAEKEAQGDIDRLIAKYIDLGLVVTHLSGRTHYLTAPTGEAPEAFIQLEVEELQEVIRRPLLEREYLPDSLEELLDPLEFTRFDPEPVGQASYRFRRITPIHLLVQQPAREHQALHNLRRFLGDWQHSSAGEGEHFCRHWVLALREFLDADGENRLIANPVSVFSGSLPPLPSSEGLRGATLANAIHGYDHRVGYPFAWYFRMLGSDSANFALADAVLRDLAGAYDYLPARDLKILRAWEERPYGV